MMYHKDNKEIDDEALHLRNDTDYMCQEEAEKDSSVLRMAVDASNSRTRWIHKKN